MGLPDRLLGYGTAVSVILILISIYLRDTSDELQSRLVSIINGLIETEERHVRVWPKVGVGYGACVDLYVEGRHFLPYTHLADPAQHFDDINSLEEFYKSYAYYFQHGAATERYMSNSTLFDSLVTLAEATPGSRYSLGGNAPVMAIRLFQEGCTVLLGSTLTPQQKQFIPKEITVVGPVITRDDIHLIVDYKAGERWGPFVSPRSNRYIIHNDVHNPHLSSFQEFQKRLEHFNPDVLVISGLQLMDNYPFKKGIRENFLASINDQMKSAGKTAKVHFEMASFSEPEMLSQLQKNIIPYADSLGMNEQELANLYSLYSYGNVSLATDSTPRVAIVLDQMRQIFKLIHISSSKMLGIRKLTRIHVHTLAYQAIFTIIGSAWKPTDIAAAKASLTAYRHVCDSPKVDLEKAALLLDDSFLTSATNATGNRVTLVPENPVTCWNETCSLANGVSLPIEVCVAPGLVCTLTSQTAGGGDNISAAALAVQI